MLFPKKGEDESMQIYDRRLHARNASQESLFPLAWEAEEYRRLLVSENELKDRTNKILCVYGLPLSETGNILKLELSMLRKDLLEYVQHIFVKDRDAVSHLLTFMVSDELRNIRPHATPIRVMPFHSLTDAKVTELHDELKVAMVPKRFVVVGFVTDGEWNPIRTQVSVIQPLMDARKESTSTNINTIKRYFELIPGTKQPRLLHPAILLNDIDCSLTHSVSRQMRFSIIHIHGHPTLIKNLPQTVSNLYLTSVHTSTRLIHLMHQVSIALRVDAAQKNVRKQRNFFMKERIMAIS